MGWTGLLIIFLDMEIVGGTGGKPQEPYYQEWGTPVITTEQSYSKITMLPAVAASQYKASERDEDASWDEGPHKMWLLTRWGCLRDEATPEVELPHKLRLLHKLGLPHRTRWLHSFSCFIIWGFLKAMRMPSIMRLWCMMTLRCRMILLCKMRLFSKKKD